MHGLFSRWGTRAPHCSGFFCCRTWALGHTGFGSWSAWALGHRLIRCGFVAPMVSGIFQDQGSNSSLLHWQANSSPISHQGSPDHCLFHLTIHPQDHAISADSVLITFCECIVFCQGSELFYIQPEPYELISVTFLSLQVKAFLNFGIYGYNRADLASIIFLNM